MELDQIKNLWNKEEVVETPEISLEKQKEIHFPLEKIRKNMRMEFWSTALIFLGIIVFFLVIDLHFFKFKVYIISLVGAQMLITTFYFFKFFNLYKNLTELSLNTAESLKDLIHQFKLNEQYYLSFYISFVPFVICEMLLVFEFTPPLKEITGLPFVLWFVGSCVLLLTGLFLTGKFWFQRFYGKYIKRICLTLEELK